MRISVKVKPGSKVETVEKTGDSEFTIRVRARAQEGKANESVIEALSGYFDIPKSRIEIAKGHTSKTKIVDIR